jgi:hypothetical protein
MGSTLGSKRRWLNWGKEGDIISGYYDGDALNIDTGMKPKK